MKQEQIHHPAARDRPGVHSSVLAGVQRGRRALLPDPEQECV